MAGRILVIRGGAIGDFVLTLPVLSALREQFPDARLEVLGYPRIARLACLGGLVDEVRSIEARALAGFFARNGDLDPGLMEYFGSCHIIVSYLYDPDGIFQTNVLSCSGAQFIVGPHRPGERPAVPAAEALLKPLERLAIFGADPVPRLRVGGAAGGVRGTGNEAGGEAGAGEAWLAVHPGSGSERKNWPEPQWAGLLGRLAERPRLRLLIVGGETEGDRIDRLASLWPGARREVARDWPLTDLACRLAWCDGFVGHDSGITHLAAAVGLPGVALWGESNEVVWRPPSPRMTVLRAGEGLDRLRVEEVLREVEGLLPSGAD